MVSKSESLKLSIKALTISVPAVVGLLVIVLLIMFTFAIIGVNLLKGKAFICDQEEILGMSIKERDNLIQTKEDCLNYGGTWRRLHYNFDNIRNSSSNIANLQV